VHLGYSSNEEIVNLFDLADTVSCKTKKSYKKAVGRRLAATVSIERMTEVVDEDTGEVIEQRIEREVILPAQHELTEEDYDALKEAEIVKIHVVREATDEDELDKTTLINTLKKDPTHSEKEALEYLYLQLRGTEAPDQDTARGVLERLFFSDKRYDLGSGSIPHQLPSASRRGQASTDAFPQRHSGHHQRADQLAEWQEQCGRH
jgi:DNA-directed RNA polymerase subunit beta